MRYVSNALDNLRLAVDDSHERAIGTFTSLDIGRYEETEWASRADLRMVAVVSSGRGVAVLKKNVPDTRLAGIIAFGVEETSIASLAGRETRLWVGAISQEQLEEWVVSGPIGPHRHMQTEAAELSKIEAKFAMLPPPAIGV